MITTKNKSYILLFFIIAIILLTNSYFNYEQSLIYGGADGISYFEISKQAPYLSDKPLKPIHAERFFFPYIIGLLSKITTLEIYPLFRISNILLILLINYYLLRFLSKYNKSLFFIFLSLLIFNLNPYQTRFYIANPLIITDLFFILGSLMAIIGIDEKNKNYFFVGLVVSSFARQSAIAIIIGIIVLKLIRKKKFFISNSNIIVSFFTFIIIYLIGFMYSKMGVLNVSHSNIYLMHFFGILLENVSTKQIIIFFIWPFLSFGPLILFYILFIKINLDSIKLNFNVSLFIIIFSTLIIIQPIISGVEMSGKNIIRLSSFSFLPILIFSIINFNLKDKIKIKTILYSLIIIIWTCHPTFSKFKFLESIKF